VGGGIQLIRARRFRQQPDDQDGVYLFVDLGCGDRTLPNLGLAFSTKLKQYIFRKQFERRS
jgi:hypothetical protein